MSKYVSVMYAYPKFLRIYKFMDKGWLASLLQVLLLHDGKA